MSFDNNDETDVNNNEVPSVEETTTKEEDGKLTALEASTEKTDPKENNPKEDEHNAKLYGNESVASAVETTKKDEDGNPPALDPAHEQTNQKESDGKQDENVSVKRGGDH